MSILNEMLMLFLQYQQRYCIFNIQKDQNGSTTNAGCQNKALKNRIMHCNGEKGYERVKLETISSDEEIMT